MLMFFKKIVFPLEVLSEFGCMTEMVLQVPHRMVKKFIKKKTEVALHNTERSFVQM